MELGVGAALEDAALGDHVVEGLGLVDAVELEVLALE